MKPSPEVLRAAKRAGLTAVPGESDEALRMRVLDVLGSRLAMPLTARDVDAIVSAILPSGVTFAVLEGKDYVLLVELHVRWWKRLFYPRDARDADAEHVGSALRKRVAVNTRVEVAWV